MPNKKNFILLNIVFLLLFELSLNANDILTSYRKNGINNLEKQMDFELAKKEYWSNYLQEHDTTFGYTEKYASVLACNKEKSILTLYKQNKTKKFQFVKEYNAFTGKIKGDKIEEGDLRTPTGVYELTKKITNPDTFYGPLAFVTSYPNSYDKYKGKNGSGIWIHGLPTEQDRDDFTKGCIAINNQNIECLNRNIDFNSTLLIINDEEVNKNIPKEELSNILAQLYAWRYAWLYNDLNKYLEFYADNFVRFDGMLYERFKHYKTRIFAKAEKKEIIFNDIAVIPYPNTKNMYQITFQEIYTSDTFKYNGSKALMIEIDMNNQMKIFTEK